MKRFTEIVKLSGYKQGDEVLGYSVEERPLELNPTFIVSIEFTYLSVWSGKRSLSPKYDYFNRAVRLVKTSLGDKFYVTME
jgi:hypothetical protein